MPLAVLQILTVWSRLPEARYPTRSTCAGLLDMSAEKDNMAERNRKNFKPSIYQSFVKIWYQRCPPVEHTACPPGARDTRREHGSPPRDLAGDGSLLLSCWCRSMRSFHPCTCERREMSDRSSRFRLTHASRWSLTRWQRSSRCAESRRDRRWSLVRGRSCECLLCQASDTPLSLSRLQTPVTFSALETSEEPRWCSTQNTHTLPLSPWSRNDELTSV